MDETLPDWVLARVENSDVEQLQQWMGRVLTAESLENIFHSNDA
jgi:hypothetical protein